MAGSSSTTDKASTSYKGEKKNERGTQGSPDVMDRVAPRNVEAEEGLLGCIIIEGTGQVMTACIEAKLKAEYFFKPAHQIIFQVLIDLYEKGSGVDEIILAEKLTNSNQLEEVGGYGFINRLTNRIETTAHAHYWLEIVREKYLLRRLISTSTSIIDRCYTSQDELAQLLEQAEQEVFSISQDRVSDSARSVREPVDEAVKMIHAMLERKGEASGIVSGFDDLDKLTFGFHPQEMIVLAARPSVGKTAFAMNVAENIIFAHGDRPATPTLVFSLEMGAAQLAMRMLCSHSRVNIKKIRDSFISTDEQKKLGKSAQNLKETPLWIDDGAQSTILELRAKARRIHAKHKLGLIIIDYLQLVSGSDSKVPREQQISEISRGVKAMAKELNLPVIVLSQLNRDSERERRAPRLSDLRESGSIEQDADVVLLLAREKDEKDEGGETGKRKLIVAKQRNGPIGAIDLAFLPDITRFENFTQQDVL